eukprot:GHVU01200824.1.p1 GENE.GHVU01200824.1~~GHVU01200824.1.p1  ORF type:complete len:260 (+),score=26.06 GHVU01200824.1:76-780(+)
MAERERDIRTQERDEARQSGSGDNAPAVDGEVSRAALMDVIEAGIIGRAAEALRRRTTEELLMGVATSEQAFRAATLRNSGGCRCHEQSTLALASTTPLPAAASHPTLSATVGTLLRCLRVAQPIRMDAHQVGTFMFDDAADRSLVDVTRRIGAIDGAAHRILESSLAIDPRASADMLIRQDWPLPIPDDEPDVDPANVSAITPDPAQRLAVVHTPPVGRSETVASQEPADGDL